MWRSVAAKAIVTRRVRAGTSWLGFTLLSAVSLSGSSPTLAQEWPDRPITMVVPFAAGGPIDTIGRILGAKLSELLGQQVIVENQGGAGGMIGAARVAKSAPDGNTVLLGGSAVLALNQAIYKKPLTDGATDFSYVAMFADSARILLTRKDFPADTLLQFNAYAKANQAKMQYGSAGAGSGTHVCAVLLDSVNGTKVAHVPYRGAGPAMQDVIAGRLDYICEQISTAVPQIEGGTVKAIAVLGLERVPVLPDLPTALELGVQGLDCGSWAALVYPKGVSPAIVTKLAAAVNAAVETPAVKVNFEKVGVTIPSRDRRTPEYLAKFTQSEIARLGAAVKSAQISAD